jgi:flavin reductase (DIM6/NTAB) family NADH-FMN oxidoreductase RutF
MRAIPARSRTRAAGLIVESPEFRRVLGHWVTGVSVVTAQPANGQPCGLTANAVCSVSLDPPLVLVCVEQTADSHDCIASAGAFSVNVLRSEQEELARRFAAHDVTEKFKGVAYHAEATGAPILDDALAWVDCRTWATYEAGDHTIYIGRVLAGDAREGAPLLYYRGGYGRFTP